MQPSQTLLSGERRFAFPRRVWFLNGTYWAGHRHGFRNAVLINSIVVGVLAFVVWPWANKIEYRHTPARYPTFSMRYLDQYKDDPYGEKMFAGQVPYKPMKHEHH